MSSRYKHLDGEHEAWKELLEELLTSPDGHYYIANKLRVLGLEPADVKAVLSKNLRDILNQETPDNGVEIKPHK